MRVNACVTFDQARHVCVVTGPWRNSFRPRLCKREESGATAAPGGFPSGHTTDDVPGLYRHPILDYWASVY